MAHKSFSGFDVVSRHERHGVTKAEVKASIDPTAKDIRKIARNTYSYKLPNGTKIIRYHNADIITTFPDGRIMLNVNGWTTPITKDRINRFCPLWIFTDTDRHGDRVWMVSDNKRELFYHEGITWSPKKGFRCKQG